MENTNLNSSRQSRVSTTITITTALNSSNRQLDVVCVGLEGHVALDGVFTTPSSILSDDSFHADMHVFNEILR